MQSCMYPLREEMVASANVQARMHVAGAGMREGAQAVYAQ